MMTDRETDLARLKLMGGNMKDIFMRWFTIALIAMFATSCATKEQSGVESLSAETNAERIALYKSLKSGGQEAIPKIAKGMRSENPYIQGYSLLAAGESKARSLIPIMIDLLDEEKRMKETTIELFPDLMGDYSGKVFSKYPKTESGGREVTMWHILSHAIYEATDKKATVMNIRNWWKEHEDSVTNNPR